MKNLAYILALNAFLYNFTVHAYTYDDVDGTNDADTIVYGELVEYYWVPQEDGWHQYTRDGGPGICVFSKSVILPFRGAFQKVEQWSGYPDDDYYRIFGDFDDDANNSGDIIYPADLYDNDIIYCGGDCGAYFCEYYIQVDSYEAPDCVGCEFPEDYEVTIYGDHNISASNGGNDVIWGWDNGDFLYGCTGNDYIYGQDGRDYIHGNDGNDDLFQNGYSGAYAHYMWGDDGQDELYGSAGNDYLYGGDGDYDELYGYGGTDRMWGDNSTGDDGIGDDCDGGDGTDYCHAVSCEIETSCTPF